MKIEYVNHASVIFNHGNIRLITDPWLESPVFNNGWDLLAKTKFNPCDFASISHIWFSHEHPDHFSPPAINKIEEAHRNNITVLYQETSDRKVARYLRGFNFKHVVELSPNSWFEIDNDFKIMCTPFGHDSWLCIKQNDITVLNTNDCVIRTPEPAEIIKDIVGDVTVLLTQFSYGQYEGNKDEPEKRREAAQEKLEQIDNQVEVFKPKYILPMASFIYFCHEENYYMNDEINKIGDVYDYFRTKRTTQPVVLYCGDLWDLKTNDANSLKAIESWNIHYENLRTSPKLMRSQPVSIADLIELSKSYVTKIQEKPILFSLLEGLSPLNIYLADHKMTVVLSSEGLAEMEVADYDIEVSSEVVDYCLKYHWGFNTTHVNARIQFRGKGLEKFIRYEYVSNAMNHNS